MQPTHAESVSATYDPTTIRLHWLTAALVASLWLIAQVIDLAPKGTPRIAVRSVHILLGVLVASVLVIRIAWRMRWGRRLPLASPGHMGRLAAWAHYGLYALLAATVVCGAANAWVRGDTIIGLFKIPQYSPGNDALREQVESLHAWFANTVVAVAAAHALVALAHHYLRRDGVLQRMTSGPASDRRPPGQG